MKIPEKIINMFLICLVMVFSMLGTAYAGYSGVSKTVSNIIDINGIGPAHKVSFVLNGGTWISGYVPPDCREQGMELELPTSDYVTNGNMVFLGWYTDKNFSGEAQTICPETQTVDITYYAKWQGDALLLTGQKFNAAIKTLVNGSSTSYSTEDTLVTAFQWADEIPDDVTTTIISASTSECELYAYFDSDSGVVYLANPDEAKVYMNADSSYMFYKFSAAASIDLDCCFSDLVTTLAYMFYDCTSLEEADLSHWNTELNTSVKCMFYCCESLVTADLSGWNTDKLTNMQSLFLHCYLLKSVDFTGWDPYNVTDMSCVFSSCYVLTDVGDISEWNTKSLTTTYYMFSSCKALEKIDLSGWNAEKITETRRMFDECNALKYVYMNGWSTPKLTTSPNMFQNCYRIKELHLENFDMSAVTNKGAMMYRVAYYAKYCDVYCTEATETALKSNTSITSSYFTFIHSEETTALSLQSINTDIEEATSVAATGSNAANETEVATGSNAANETEVATGSNAESPTASDSNAIGG